VATQRRCIPAQANRSAFRRPAVFLTGCRIGSAGEANTLGLVSLAGLAAAFWGKAEACDTAARYCSESRSDALGIGILMNARGLMGLFILNIGLEYGVITPALFSVLILMAAITPLMAAPMFSRCCRPVATPISL
jgi:Kef-type K+ transport system membrane component KefB